MSRSKKIQNVLLKAGISKHLAEKMSLKLTDLNVDSKRGKYRKDNKWGEIINRKKTRRKKLSKKAKIAQKKIVNTLKFRVKSV